MELDNSSVWAEIQQRADQLEQCFLKILSPQSDSSYWGDFQDLKRELHTLKGVCGLSGLGDAARQIHSLESLAKEASERKLSPTQTTASLESSIRSLLESLRSNQSGDHSPEISDDTKEPQPRRAKPKESSDLFESALNSDQKRQLEALAQERKRVFHLRYSQQESPKPLKDLRSELDALTQILIAVPKVNDSLVHFHFLVVEHPQLPQLVEKYKLESVPYNLERDDSQDVPPTSVTPKPIQTGHEVRLESQKIEDLHRRCSDLITKFWKIKDSEALKGPKWEQFEEVLKGLQSSVLSTRLVRLETLFQRFPLEVRKVASDLGKTLRIEITGDRLEIDRDIVQGLAEPLRHLLLNAVVHGIEPPRTRLARHKEQAGLISLEASMSGAFLTLKVSDDGRGIDRELLSQKCGHRLHDDQELLEQLCQPGWSTRAQSDLTSGRGLGMDIVQKSLTRLRGSVELSTESGSGTTFTVTLPTSLTTLSIVEVVFGEITLAFARDSISRVINLQEMVLGGTDEQILCQLDGSPVPLFDVAETLQLDISKSQANTGLVCRGLTGLVILRVPAPAGIRDIVLQPCESPFLAKDWLDGVTTLGSGKTAFLVSISGFIERARHD